MYNGMVRALPGVYDRWVIACGTGVVLFPLYKWEGQAWKKSAWVEPRVSRGDTRRKRFMRSLCRGWPSRFSHSSSRAWPTAGPHFMHSLRALRRAFTKKLGLSHRQDKYAILRLKFKIKHVLVRSILGAINLFDHRKQCSVCNKFCFTHEHKKGHTNPVALRAQSCWQDS